MSSKLVTGFLFDMQIKKHEEIKKNDTGGFFGCFFFVFQNTQADAKRIS